MLQKVNKLFNLKIIFAALKTSISYRSIFLLALPIIISGISQNIVTVVDTAFLGALGIAELGAAGNMGILYLLMLTIGMGYTNGAQIIIARRNGESNFDKIGDLIYQSLYFLIPLSMILLLVMQFALPSFIQAISHSEDVIIASQSYMSMRSFGIGFAFVNFIFISFFVGSKQTKILFYSTLLMSITNIILDYGLIFGHLGLPKLGVQGAAIASVMSELVTAVYLGYFVLVKNDLVKYGLNLRSKFNIQALKRIMSLASPIMLQLFLTLGSWFIFFSWIEAIGEDELAISHIIRSIYMVLLIPLFGFGQAANSLVSNLIGSKQYDDVLTLTWRVIVLTIIATAFLVAITAIYPIEILNIFDLEPRLIQSGLDTLHVIQFSCFLLATSFVLFNCLMGTGNSKIALLIEAINLVFYLSTAYLIINYFAQSIDQVWYSEFIYFICLGTFSFIYLKSKRWITDTKNI
jgi:putative MATE family efflux protein